MNSLYDPGENIFDWLILVEKVLRDFGCTGLRDNYANTKTVYITFDHDKLASGDNEYGTKKLRIANHAPNYNNDWDYSVDKSESSITEFFLYLAKRLNIPIPLSAKALEDYPYPPL